MSSPILRDSNKAAKKDSLDLDRYFTLKINSMSQEINRTSCSPRRRLQNEVINYQEAVGKVCKENEDSRASIRSQEGAIVALSHEVAHLRQQLSTQVMVNRQRELEFKDIEQRYQNSVTMMEKASKELLIKERKALVKLHDEEVQQLQLVIQQITSRNQLLQQNLANRDQRMVDLEHINSFANTCKRANEVTIEQKHQDLTQIHQQLQVEYESLQRKFSLLQQQCQQFELRNDEFRNNYLRELNTKTTELTKLQEMVDHLEVDVCQLKSQNLTMERHNQLLEQQRMDNEWQISNLNNEITSYSRQVEQLHLSNQELNLRVGGLEQEKINIINEYDSQIDLLNDIINKLKLDLLNQEKQSSASKLYDQNQMLQLQNQIEQLQLDNRQLNSKVSSMQCHRKGPSQSYKYQDEYIESLQRQLDQYKDQLHESQEKELRLNTNLKRLEADLKYKDSLIEDHAQELSQYQKLHSEQILKLKGR